MKMLLISSSFFYKQHASIKALKKWIGTLTLLCLVFPVAESLGQETTAKATYTFNKGDPNGIGKWYMNREIAHVMGYQGMYWLNRPEREKEENTTKLLANMAIGEEDVIADIGAGSGYHVFKMAPLASRGHVYAVDIQEEMLNAIRKQNEKVHFSNISLVKGSETSVNLPENSVDKVLMVDVYHEFNYPAAMIASIKKALLLKSYSIGICNASVNPI